VAHYDVDIAWDDPFERPRENRKSRRFNIRMSTAIAVHDIASQRSLRGAGLVRNMSGTGIRLATKHRLVPGQRVTLAVPTKHCHENMCLPPAFIGPAEVVRVEPGHDGCSEVAMRFCEPFLQDIEFAVFIESLERAVMAS